ncbi:MAG TPA: hypothetical protein VFZ38_10320 [Vicinamibacterales bacterium]
MITKLIEVGEIHAAELANFNRLDSPPGHSGRRAKTGQNAAFFQTAGSACGLLYGG